MRRRKQGAVLAVALALGLAACGDGGGGDGGGNGGGSCTGTCTLPAANARFDYQLGGAYPPPAGVTVVSRDRTAAPVSGLYNLCYVNAFQTQPGTDGSEGDITWWKTNHDDLLLKSGGGYVEDATWGEILLDTGTAAKREAILAIVGGWIDGCKASGFQAVEPDNLDSWDRSQDLLTKDDNVAMATLLAARAHADGLAIAQKNAAELAGQRASIGFDLAVAEECQVYGECGDYTDAYGDLVFEIEYSDNARRYFDDACAARGASISILYRDRDLVPQGEAGYVYESC